DVNVDGFADITTGAGPGGALPVQTFSGADGTLMKSFMPFSAGYSGGVFVALHGTAALAVTGTGSSTITDLFVFRSPANANNTVLIMDFQPFPGNLAPEAADPTQQYEINIDNHDILAATQDITFRVTYGAPDANDVQPVTLSEILASNPGVSIPLAQGRTGGNAPTGVSLPIAGGGMFRSGIHDEPFFFDKGAFDKFIAAGMAGSFPRAPGIAHNFYGPNVNTFSIIFEVPSTLLGGDPVINPKKIVSVWGTISKNGVQLDR